MSKPPDPQDFVERVARRIADAREAAGVTQQELAERLRVSVRYLQTVEGGQNISVHWLGRIAGALGIDPSALTVAYPEGETAKPKRRMGRPRRVLETPVDTRPAEKTKTRKR